MDNNPDQAPAQTPVPEPVSPAPEPINSPEPNISSPEPSVAPAEPNASPTEPTATALDPIVSPTEPIASPTEPEAPVSDPVVPAAEPTTSTPDPAPTSPVSTVPPSFGSEATQSADNPSSPFSSTATSDPFPQSQDNLPSSEPVGASSKKGISGKLIGLIIGIVVIILGGIGAFLFFILSSGNPTEITNEAFINLLSQDSIGYKASLEATQGSISLSYSLEAFQQGDVAYVRMEGLKSFFSALLSSFGVSASSQLDGLNETIDKIDGAWWKIEGDDSVDESTFSGILKGGIVEREKTLSAFKGSPFFIAEKVDGGDTYGTSGTAYKVKVDGEKLNAYKELLGDDVNSEGIALGTITIGKSDSSLEEFIVTISKPLFGKATLTGLYVNKEEEGSIQKIAIDFEHALKSAPTDFKDISAIEGIIEEAGQKTDQLSAQRDVQRRNDYMGLSAAMTAYMTNNNGVLPGNGSLDPAKYINSDGKDPNGYAYLLEVIDYSDYSWYSSIDSDGTTVFVIKHAGCNGNEVVEKESNYAFAVYGSLESGSYSYCTAHN